MPAKSTQPKIELPKKFRTNWLKDLRSGKFKQGRYNLLRRHKHPGYDSYCCLGVACVHEHNHKSLINHRSILDTIIEKIPPSSTRFGGKEARDQIREALYRQSTNNQNLQEHLIFLNDDEKWTFRGIARFIEQRTIGV